MMSLLSDLKKYSSRWPTSPLPPDTFRFPWPARPCEGWVCLKCGRVYGPSIPYCEACNRVIGVKYQTKGADLLPLSFENARTADEIIKALIDCGWIYEALPEVTE